MIILNNLWDDVLVNVRSFDKFYELVSDNNFDIDANSVTIKPLEKVEIKVDQSDTIYFYSYDNRKKCDRTDYATSYSLMNPKKLMLAELKWNTYDVKDKSAEKEFEPDTIFSMSYIMPSRIIAGFMMYNLLYVFFVILAIVATVIGVCYFERK
jgi:hypothetical protein